MTTRVETVAENRHSTRQGYLLDRTVKASCYGPPVERLRIEVYRDSYDIQSYARVSLWSGTQWNVVASLRGEEPEMKAGPSYVGFNMADPNDPGTLARMKWQDQIAARLLDTALAVVLMGHVKATEED